MSAGGERAASGRDAALQIRLLQIGVFILVAGVLVGVLSYVRAAPDGNEGAIGYVIEGGQSYPVRAEDSKRYEYEAERVAGTSGMLAAELTEWFGSLWHGRKLASMVIVVSIGASLACFLGAWVLSHPLPDDWNDGEPL
jgi:hypothetical protein